jgi:hypothetical protein
VRVYEYEKTDLDNLSKTVFRDCTVIGRSSFEGTYEDPKKLIPYAQSVGADIIITNKAYTKTSSSFSARTAPLSGATPARPAVYGTSASYGPGVSTLTTYTSVSKPHFDQNALFLRSAGTPVWDKKETDFPKTGESSFDGIWSEQFYSIKVYRSNDYIVGFIYSKVNIKFSNYSVAAKNAAKKREIYKVGDMKFIFNAEDKTGVYITDENNPMAAEIDLTRRKLVVTVEKIDSTPRYTFEKRQ